MRDTYVSPHMAEEVGEENVTTLNKQEGGGRERARGGGRAVKTKVIYNSF